MIPCIYAEEDNQSWDDKSHNTNRIPGMAKILGLINFFILMLMIIWLQTRANHVTHMDHDGGNYDEDGDDEDGEHMIMNMMTIYRYLYL